MLTRHAVCLLALLLPPCLAPGQAADAPAKDSVYQLPPVIVNPTHAMERESPVTFSNLGPVQIGDRYATRDVPSILSELPSVTWYSESGSGMGYGYINLRGFDQKRISVMINGVPQNDPEDHDVYWVDFPDLLASTQSIQVQRGAGSAFYGPPAIGGSVNLVTNPFTPEPRITMESDFGFQEFGDSSAGIPLNSKRFDISVNSGLVNRQYMVYGRMATLHSSGYRTHSAIDQNAYFLGAMRIDSNVTTRFHCFGGPIADELSYNGLPKFTGTDLRLRRANWGDWNSDSSWVSYSPLMHRVIGGNGHDTVYVVPRRAPETEEFSQPHLELMNDWKISSAITLSSTIFYYTGEGYFDYDASWADTSTLRLGSAYGIPATANPGNTLFRGFVGNRQWGWLPRAEISHGSGTMSVGAEIRIHRSTHWGKIQFAEHLPAGLDPDYHVYEYNGEKDIISGYVHELYRPDPRVSVLADLQLVHNRYGIANEKYLGNNFSLPYLFLNPRTGINFNVSESFNGYFSAAYTSREPRLRNLYAAEDSYFGATPQFAADTSGGITRYDFSRPIAQPEHLLDFEIGAGYLSTSARLNADVYWMEFTNELIPSGQVDIFGQPVTGNAERTRHVGLELDGAVSLTSAVELSGNLTASVNRLIHHTVFTATYDSSGNTVYVPESLDSNPIAGFPDLLGNIRLTWRAEWGMVSVLAKYVGPMYTDNFRNDANRNSDYTVFNVESRWNIATVNETHFALRAMAYNILDRLYFQGGQGDSFFPAAERNYVIGLTATY